MSDRIYKNANTERGFCGILSMSNVLLSELAGRIAVVIALPFALPLMAVIVIAIRFTSPGPAILRLTRTRADNSQYREYRFRCVWEDARARMFQQDLTGEETIEQDPRVTPVGAFLIRTGLNTLPQLFNVLKGDIPLSLQGRG